MNFKITTRNLLVAVLLLMLCALPLFAEKFYVQLFSKILIMGIFAMSLDLLVGYVGLVSLGHAAFFGLAGYCAALLSPQYEAGNFFVSFSAAISICILFALLTGVLALRTKSFYFIMVTLAFAQMIFFIFHDTKIGGGGDGIYIYQKPLLAISGITLLELENFKTFYWFTFGWLIAIYAFLRILLQSHYGHALGGIKVNEHRMRALGYPVFWYKLSAYVIAGSIGGIAGYFNAIQFGFVNPENISWHTSANVLMMVILGGMGSLHGAVFGASVFILLQELISNESMLGSFASHWSLMMGFFIVAVSLFLPNGLTGLFSRGSKK
ncbi:MAG: branched-chain amino acid ABC transporter permease [Rhodocyclaceae bacterium]|nr:MAG: branched-chain amino acid ABC transporter permease [Rhodocyclaceae bacterium]